MLNPCLIIWFNRSMMVAFSIGVLTFAGCLLNRAVAQTLVMEDATKPPQSLEGFRNPDLDGGQTELRAIGGYQRGKIPVVFVHGLASDSTTWDETILALQRDPELNHLFQFWTFRYPTGISYLHSAAQLRAAWCDALNRCDPQHTDAALQHAVFVGHSMGGLLSRLQVTGCRDELWKCFPRQTIEQLAANSTMLADMRRVLVFSPHRTIRRVIYIGTPHGGSIATNSVVGRIASRMVRFPDELQNGLDAMRASGADSLPARLPTAVDHLAPGNAILTTVAGLSIAPGVKTHSIIGSGYLTPPRRLGDRIVTVESARTPGVESELLIQAKHMTIHRVPETIAELRRILGVHAQETFR